VRRQSVELRFDAWLRPTPFFKAPVRSVSALPALACTRRECTRRKHSSGASAGRGREKRESRLIRCAVRLVAAMRSARTYPSCLATTKRTHKHITLPLHPPSAPSLHSVPTFPLQQALSDITRTSRQTVPPPRRTALLAYRAQPRHPPLSLPLRSPRPLVAALATARARLLRPHARPLPLPPRPTRAPSSG